MVVYWALFLIPAAAAFVESSGRAGRPFFFFLLFLVFLVVAFRETGGDWYTYNLIFQAIDGSTFSDALTFTDPGYGALNWIASQLGWGIYGVNAVCALIFLVGFARFSASEARPLLMLAVAIPYLVIVVVVGYTRQGTAVGFELLALSALMRRSAIQYLLWVGAAAVFHFSAVVLLPLVYFAIPKQSGLQGRILALGTLLAAWYFGQSEFTASSTVYMNEYIASDHYQSDGALIRSLLSGVAGLFFLVNWHRWGKLWNDRDLWLVFSLTAFALVPLSIIASTAADRMGLYVIPLQIIVFVRLPLLQRSQQKASLTVTATLLLYGLVLAIWLHVGNFASVLWLPFRSLLLGEIA